MVPLDGFEPSPVRLRVCYAADNTLEAKSIVGTTLRNEPLKPECLSGFGTKPQPLEIALQGSEWLPPRLNARRGYPRHSALTNTCAPTRFIHRIPFSLFTRFASTAASPHISAAMLFTGFLFRRFSLVTGFT